ncbi:MAG TPA: hypothetical protein VEL74_01470 [Thermoanaerobaculia bacterium]|nr:hypothetical protein [Thermoanaerobaculia bacterium]
MDWQSVTVSQVCPHWDWASHWLHVQTVTSMEVCVEQVRSGSIAQE